MDTVHGSMSDDDGVALLTNFLESARKENAERGSETDAREVREVLPACLNSLLMHLVT